MKNPPVISIWKSSYGFFIDFFRIHRRRSRIEMPNLMDSLWITHGHIVAAVWLIWPPALRLIWFDSLSDWYDEMRPHFDMIDDLSYWYDLRIPFGFITEISPSRIEMKPHRFLTDYFLDWWWARLILIWPKAVVLIWLDARFRIEMIRIEMMSALVLICLSHSYWYDPLSRIDMWRERKILYPLLSLNRKVIFLIILTGKIEGH